MKSGKHGVIVLNPGGRSSLTCRSKSVTESDEAAEIPESNDPAVIRKIVRRQAALASAGRRKATIAATHQKRILSGHREGSQQSSSSRKNSHDETDSQLNPGTFEIGNGRVDPFAAHPIDFDAVKDPNVLPSLFNLFMVHVAPLLDLRLPTQEDRRLGRRYSWQKELPHMALFSPPCFWSLMLGAAAQIGARNGSDPSTSLMTLGFRHMCIRSINKRLQSSPETFSNDFGLLLGIAILGSWEKWWGSQEACQAHCDGLKLLGPYFQDDDQPHDLFAQVMTFANTYGSGPGVKVESSEDTPRVVELEGDSSIGFDWIAERTYIHSSLVRYVCGCRSIEQMHPGDAKTRALQSQAALILNFNTKPRVRDMTIKAAPTTEADRINLEMHIILQAAGIAMLNFMAEDPEEAGTGSIDVVGMCDEVADLAKSVVFVPLYDQLLLWAMVTVFALSRHYPEGGLRVIRTVTGRMQIDGLPIDAVETYMEAFVFLESAREEYNRLLALVAPLPTEIQLAQGVPSIRDAESSCYTQ